jgi:hypothetical protein
MLDITVHSAPRAARLDSDDRGDGRGAGSIATPGACITTAEAGWDAADGMDCMCASTTLQECRPGPQTARRGILAVALVVHATV